ncbi:hypothetical protein B0T25DRAFT_575085 [Lasiosphaeria hispida]|uniref:Uncharacterized protein n=1 Tax=Lasiosphaeria hispida TaxID=260671 RepID=A0AAJ0HT83_9PEZI|nr:hypothetical protein B0T25DRAFT_575085 [Lasiosphaeria hispida]
MPRKSLRLATAPDLSLNRGSPPSPRPSTVDLIRADLGRTWSVWANNFSPNNIRNPSISLPDDNDMVFIGPEFAPTTRIAAAPSKIRKQDPLEEMLKGVFDTTPVPEARLTKGLELPTSYQLPKTAGENETHVPEEVTQARHSDHDFDFHPPYDPISQLRSQGASESSRHDDQAVLAHGTPVPDTPTFGLSKTAGTRNNATSHANKALSTAPNTRKRKVTAHTDTEDEYQPSGHKNRGAESSKLRKAVKTVAGPPVPLAKLSHAPMKKDQADVVTVSAASDAATNTTNFEPELEPELESVEYPPPEQPRPARPHNKGSSGMRPRYQDKTVEANQELELNRIMGDRESANKSKIANPAAISSSPLIVQRTNTTAGGKNDDITTTVYRENPTPSPLPQDHEGNTDMIEKKAFIVAPEAPRKGNTLRVSRPSFSPFLLNPPVDRTLAYQGAEGHGNTENLRPENIWKRATADDSPPAILHKIVSILHRSLKSKEDAIGDIVREYEENASQLLQNMNMRHMAEKSETEKTHRKASHMILDAFTGAGEALTDIIDGLQAINVEDTLAAVKHSGFLRKLDTLCRLYDSSNEQSLGIHEEEPVGESESASSQHEELVEEFQTKLLEMAKSSDETEEASGVPEDDALQQIYAEADKLLNGPIRGASRNQSSELTKDPEPATNTIYDVMEGLFDTMINSMQNPAARGDSLLRSASTTNLAGIDGLEEEG